MPADKIRADYDQLKTVAGTFGGLAQDTRQTMQSLKQPIASLQGGDWVGPGATAFYLEMSGQVMPSLQRLAEALDSAQTTTTRIGQIVAEAESDAARILRGTGGRPAPQESDGGATAAEMIGVASEVVGAANAIGGSQLAAAAATGILAGLKSGNAPVAVVDAVTKALEEGSVDRMLGGFDDSVRDMVKQSPSLRGEMLRLECDGYTVVPGPAGDGSATDVSGKTITIASPRDAESMVRSMAHEAGHAIGDRPASIPITETMTRDEYVRLSVENDMLGEGDATFNNAKVRDEIIAAGGPDIGISGTQTAAYEQVYADFKAGAINQAEAVERMGALVGSERTSIPPKKPYLEYYGDSHREYWDAEIAPSREPL